MVVNTSAQRSGGPRFEARAWQLKFFNFSLKIPNLVQKARKAKKKIAKLGSQENHACREIEHALTTIEP